MATLTVNTTLADGAVTNTKLADMAQGTVKGRAAGAGTGDPQDLTPDQASAILDAATDPFVRTSAAATGDVVGPASATDEAIARFDLTTGKLIQNSTVLLDNNGKLGQVDAIDLDTTPTSAAAAGRIRWNSTEGAPEAGLAGGNVTALLGTDLHVLAYNNTGSTIAKGKVVRVNGSSGTRLTIALAQGDGDLNSADTIGLTSEAIGINSSGYIITRGIIRAVNTNAYNEGDTLYVSPTTAGEITNVKPSAPNHMVRVGYVIKKAGIADGIIYVDPLNGFELEELHDVRITTPATNTVGLFWNATDSVWENRTPANARTALGLGTLATQSGTFSGTSSGTNTGDQTITLTGDVTGSGTGSFAATIANDAVSNAKLANMATTTIKGRVSAGAGDPEDLSASQARTVLGLGTAALNNTGDFDLAANTVRGRLASDFTTNSATFVDVAPSGVNFEVTLEANSTYWFYFYGIYQSANAGTGVGLSFTFSNSPTVISLFTTRVASTAQAGTVTVPSLITASDGGNIANSVTDINTNLPNFSRGLIVTGANASVVRCRIARGGAANNVTLRAGSSILAHKIA